MTEARVPVTDDALVEKVALEAYSADTHPLAQDWEQEGSHVLERYRRIARRAIAIAYPAGVAAGREEARADLTVAAHIVAAAIEHMNEGYDWDGCDMQDACKKAGLTFERPYDPETDHSMDAGEGDTVWVPTKAGERLLALARSTAIRQRGEG